MEFITGGRAQGKRTYTRKLCSTKPVITRGCAVPQKAMENDVVIWDHLEEMIRDMTATYLGEVRLTDAKNADVNKLSQNFYDRIYYYIEKYNVDYVICDEVGSGIVPMEFEERLYRELCGRIGVLLAENAEHVHHVVCGIGEVIK